jgi:hypothetical protein
MADRPPSDKIVINDEDVAGPSEPPGAASAPPAPPKLVISKEDLEATEPGAPRAPRVDRRLRVRRFWHAATASRLALSIAAGGLSALLAWGLTEAFLRGGPTGFAGVLLFGVMAGCLGFGLGALEGARARNLRRALRGGALAFAVGAGLALAVTGLGRSWVQQVLEPAAEVSAARVLMRALAWAGLGAVVGLAQGVPFGSRWKVRRGIAGGLAGGALAGLLFDPLALWTQGTLVSRLVGLTLTGALTGLGVGLVSEWRRPAWLGVTRGPLAGCEFVLHRPTFLIGSEARCDAPLRGDPAVGPRHAAILARPGGYYVEDQASPTGTFINGTLTRRHRLVNGDSIGIGQSLFVYYERDVTPAEVSYHSAVGTP